MIIVRTPLRVSFFGGGTDHPDWFEASGKGAVLSTAINKYVYIQMRVLPAVFDFRYRVVWRKVEQVDTIDEIEHPVVRAVLKEYCKDDPCGYEIVYNADLPARSGLGSSSAFTVAILHAISHHKGYNWSQEELARRAIHVEQVLLEEPVGCQDQIAVAVGGLNKIEFKTRDQFVIDPCAVISSRRDTMESSLMMFFTGFTRSAGTIEQQKKNNFNDRTAELTRMYEMVSDGTAILGDVSRSVDEIGALLHEGWMLKRGLASAVSSGPIDEAYQRALSAGALGGKLLGAGGGGFLLFYVRPQERAAVLSAMSDFTHVPIRFDHGGSSVVLNDPEMTSNYETHRKVLEAATS
jgi:D-glycero-alpha-D-manno-heptose-7-phosphate kinase